jgi:hypothetical protein
LAWETLSYSTERRTSKVAVELNHILEPLELVLGHLTALVDCKIWSRRAWMSLASKMPTKKPTALRPCSSSTLALMRTSSLFSAQTTARKMLPAVLASPFFLTVAQQRSLTGRNRQPTEEQQAGRGYLNGRADSREDRILDKCP